MNKDSNISVTENDYVEILNAVITQINAAGNSLAIKVNTTAASAYWIPGKLLYDRKPESRYGSNIINRLLSDLKSTFSDMGFSPGNLGYMKKFYERYFSASEKLQCVAISSWRQTILLFLNVSMFILLVLFCL